VQNIDYEHLIQNFLDTVSANYIKTATATAVNACTSSVDVIITIYNEKAQKLRFETTYDPCSAGFSITPYLFPTILWHNNKRTAIRNLPLAFFIKQSLVKGEMTDVFKNELLIEYLMLPILKKELLNLK
jgi:hypothetical protein